MLARQESAWAGSFRRPAISSHLSFRRSRDGYQRPSSLPESGRRATATRPTPATDHAALRGWEVPLRERRRGEAALVGHLEGPPRDEAEPCPGSRAPGATGASAGPSASRARPRVPRRPRRACCAGRAPRPPGRRRRRPGGATTRARSRTRCFGWLPSTPLPPCSPRFQRGESARPISPVWVQSDQNAPSPRQGPARGPTQRSGTRAATLEGQR